MAITEKQRHDLMKAAEEVLGPVEAETLMNLLPPVGWADVATKADLEHLRTATKADIDGVRVEVAHLREHIEERVGRFEATLRVELERGLRQQLVTFLSAQAVLFGAVLALVQLSG